MSPEGFYQGSLGLTLGVNSRHEAIFRVCVELKPVGGFPHNFVASEDLVLGFVVINRHVAGGVHFFHLAGHDIRVFGLNKNADGRIVHGRLHLQIYRRCHEHGETDA